MLSTIKLWDRMQNAHPSQASSLWTRKGRQEEGKNNKRKEKQEEEGKINQGKLGLDTFMGITQPVVSKCSGC